MRQATLYVFAAAALVLIVSVAWWTRESVRTTVAVDTVQYTVQPGDTVEKIAKDHGVTLAALLTANNLPPGDVTLTPDQPIVVPPKPADVKTVWLTHLLGMSGEVLGVLMSLWLALVAGMLPKHIRRQVLGIAVVVGIVSYASTHVVVGEPVLLSPTFLFIAIKDGFAWAAAFPMLARAIGIRDVPPAAPARAEPSSPEPAQPDPTASTG